VIELFRAVFEYPSSQLVLALQISDLVADHICDALPGQFLAYLNYGSVHTRDGFVIPDKLGPHADHVTVVCGVP
jgi:hypothetical protein